jgi:DNA-binding NtrC family response regulator
VTFDCCAIPSNLLENELFGHRRGAYTDARSNQQGLIAEAEGGTLFLDEIDTLDLHRDQRADIRIIAATNTNLWKKVEAGLFRQDLYYRLNLTLHLPPLRERKRDVPLLAEHFVKKYKNEHRRSRITLSSGAVRKLLHHDWPGNIRELENVIQQAILFTHKSTISATDLKLPSTLLGSHAEKLSFREAKIRAIEVFEMKYVQELLLACQGNITTAARKARKDRADFSRLVKKYHRRSISG